MNNSYGSIIKKGRLSLTHLTTSSSIPCKLLHFSIAIFEYYQSCFLLPIEHEMVSIEKQ